MEAIFKFDSFMDDDLVITVSGFSEHELWTRAVNQSGLYKLRTLRKVSSSPEETFKEHYDNFPLFRDYVHSYIMEFLFKTACIVDEKNIEDLLNL